jgi:hypothetical protein
MPLPVIPSTVYNRYNVPGGSVCAVAQPAEHERADALGISQDAVKQHVAAIKKRLRVQTRAQIGFHRRVP